MGWLEDRIYGKKKLPEPPKKRRDFKFDDYDHRWHDHPSWYTDSKRERQQMIINSKKRRKQNWD